MKMIIESSWIDNKVKSFKVDRDVFGKYTEEWQFYEESIVLLEEVKEQLQSPVDIIKEAFIAGNKANSTWIEKELEDYLKEKGIDDDSMEKSK